MKNFEEFYVNVLGMCVAPLVGVTITEICSKNIDKSP